MNFLFVFSSYFQVLRYLGVSDGNMAEGSMRLDVNVSLRPKDETCFNTKVLKFLRPVVFRSTLVVRNTRNLIR